MAPSSRETSRASERHSPCCCPQFRAQGSAGEAQGLRAGGASAPQHSWGALEPPKAAAFVTSLACSSLAPHGDQPETPGLVGLVPCPSEGPLNFPSTPHPQRSPWATWLAPAMRGRGYSGACQPWGGGSRDHPQGRQALGSGVAWGAEPGEGGPALCLHLKAHPSLFSFVVKPGQAGLSLQAPLGRWTPWWGGGAEGSPHRGLGHPRGSVALGVSGQANAGATGAGGPCSPARGRHCSVHV